MPDRSGIPPILGSAVISSPPPPAYVPGWYVWQGLCSSSSSSSSLVLPAVSPPSVDAMALNPVSRGRLVVEPPSCCSVEIRPRSMSCTISACDLVLLEAEMFVLTPHVLLTECLEPEDAEWSLPFCCRLGVWPRSWPPARVRLRDRLVTNFWKREGRMMVRSWRTAGSEAQTIPAASSAPVQTTTLT